MGLNPITTTDSFLAQISGQLDEQNALLQRLAGALAPEQPAELDPKADASADDKPAGKKQPAKQTTARRKVNGQ